MKIKKAVIPAAGLGTRVLPFTKAVPKEMIPIVDKPGIQYIVEEAAASGIEDILIILSRGKTVVEDHFDLSPELTDHLASHDKHTELNAIRALTSLANITYIRQQEMKGLGHAVLCAKSFVGDEPFAVLYGDDVIISEDPVCGQLMRAYDEYGHGCVGIKEVTPEQLMRYSSMKVTPLRDNLYNISDMIEKPRPGQEFSSFAVLGRCILPSKIFPILEALPRGAGGEYQLTDAMRELSRGEGMTGVDFIGTRYDMGNKLGILQANIEVALTHPEIGKPFTQYLRTIAERL